MPSYLKTGYGLSEALPNIFPSPILANRAPTTADKNFQIGQLWIYVSQNETYILTSIVSNLANWELLETSGGSGSFTTLTSTGQFNLDTTAVGANTLGNTTGATSITSSVGTGGYTVDGVGASSYAFGASTTTGTMAFGGTAGTGGMTFGSSSATQAIGIGVGLGATTVNIGTGSVSGNTINVATAANTSAQVVNVSSGASGADSTVNILSGTATAGVSTLNLATGNYAKIANIATGTLGSTVNVATGINSVAQTVSISSGASAADSTVSILSGVATAGVSTLNLATGTLAAGKIVHIADGASPNVVTIGSLTGAAATTIQAGSGEIYLRAAGQVRVDALSDIQASPSATAVINGRVGYATFTGFTTGAAAAQVFTITNSVVLAASVILVSANNLGANDAQMTVTRVVPGAGTFNVTLTNFGAAALNGDVNISFWVLQD